MNGPHRSLSIVWLERAYAGVLWIFPTPFRHRFAREMRLAFAAEAREIQKRFGNTALLPFVVRITLDTLAAAGKEHLAMPQRLLLITTVLILLVVNWLTFHDLFEPHTVRDYLTLVASLFVFVHIGLEMRRPRVTIR